MAVQIVITGDHATDAIAELKNLTKALTGPVRAREPQESFGENTFDGVAPIENDKSPAEAISEAKHEEEIEKPKKLSAQEQSEAVKEMIEAGEKDERFDLLSKGRKSKIEKALEEAEEIPVEDTGEQAEDDDLSSMFDDGEPEEQITPDKVREIMANVGKDEDDEPIKENLIKVREILTANIPEGEEIKVGNIPQDKLVDVYNGLKALEN